MMTTLQYRPGGLAVSLRSPLTSSEVQGHSILQPNQRFPNIKTSGHSNFYSNQDLMKFGVGKIGAEIAEEEV